MKKLILVLTLIPFVFSCSSSDEDELISGKKFLEKYNGVSWGDEFEAIVFYNSPKSLKHRFNGKCTTYIFGQDQEDMTLATQTFYIIEESENSLKLRVQEYYNGDSRGSDETTYSVSDDGSILNEAIAYREFDIQYPRFSDNICN
jgi:hypothetical protein